MLRFFLIATLGALALGGCAWVKLTEGAEQVRAIDVEEVAGCDRIGETTVSVRDRVAAVQRSPGKVAEELERLARNEAAELGGNRIVALGPVTDGRRSYAVHDCRPG